MRKLYYMIVDTETATLPFADYLAEGNSNLKKKIAIAKPLIYDIGWTICDRTGNIYERKQFLVAETFTVPSIFNTAYYAEKRPIYIEMLQKKETVVLPWNDIMSIFIADLQCVDAVGAFNAMFDFKKAIPFTELYISKVYSKNYYSWEMFQRHMCEKIIDGSFKENPNKNFDPNHFDFRGKQYNLFDIWGLATTYLLNTVTYKQDCLNRESLTNSGTFFKTSAEQCYRFLCDKYDFIESHTALDDAIIETFILSQIAKRHSITMGIKYFPFRDLGTTYDFCMHTKRPKIDDCMKVYDAIARYIEAQTEQTKYVTNLINQLQKIAEYAGFESAY